MMINLVTQIIVKNLLTCFKNDDVGKRFLTLHKSQKKIDTKIIVFES